MPVAADWRGLNGLARQSLSDPPMFILLAIILAIAWVAGFTVMHVSSALIHLLLVLAVVSVIVHLARGRGATR
jgi:hypothetical protein